MPVKKLGILGITLFLLFLTSCGDKERLFESLSPSKTNITFTNHLPERPGFNILYYLYYYEGGGVATGDINNDGLPDIYFTANTRGNNKLYINKGNFKFEDITAKAGVAGISEWCSGVTMADVNGDGWLDIYVCAVSQKLGLQGHNQLFINNHDGTFTDKSAEYGLDFSCYSAQAVFFDYDHDGDLDCYLLNESDRPNQNIVDTSHRRIYDAHSGDKLLRNDLNTAAKKFTDVSAAAGIYQGNLGYGLGLAVGDLNNDGWDDIYIGNDFHENDYYYINNGNGTFTESGAKHFQHYSRFSMGNDIADYNNDGQLDLITVDMLPKDEKILKTYGSDENPEIYKFKLTTNGYQYQYSKNCLQRNNGNGGTFSETSLLSGVAATDWSWSPLFADFDNDGNKDLFITSGIVKRTTDLDYVKFVSNAYMQRQPDNSDKLDEEAISKMPDGISHSFIYKGNGKLNFEDKSDEWGLEKYRGYFNGASYADLDNDGNLDLVVNATNAPAMIYKNNAPKKNFLSISFKGEGGNTFGIGSKAYVFQKNKMQYEQLMLTRGFQSSSDTRLHFGLDSSGVDSIIIVWPDQKFQVLKSITINKQLIVEQKNAGGIFIYDDHFKPASALFSSITDSVKLPWKHREDNFQDYNVQYLIPHAESTRGPKIATADVNGDGLEDFYASGAAGQSGTLMLQQPNGNFISSDTAVFSLDKNCEDVDAKFFDANGDGHPDLYVVSGGNEFFGDNSGLIDRLYINDGKGHFTKTVNSLPAIFQNKSCVTVADIDKDGDEDIFVGTLADSKAFGIPQTSYLLMNDGKGNFSIADHNTIQLTNIGMVTSASFADVNKDGWVDLIVAGEWMPVTIYLNQNGKFKKTIVPNSTGLWENIFIDDVDKDGNLDFIAGNWGLNNKFSSGKSGPLNLYVADFDQNGHVEQLLSYFSSGQEYPFLPKDEVERQLPALKTHYLLYSDYAGVPMKDVFYGWVDTIKPYPAERLASAIFYGDGMGKFTIKDLPPELQLTPMFSFQKVNTAKEGNMFLAGGNFFDVSPYEGRYDAQALGLFSVDRNRNVHFIPQINLSSVTGQVRDLKWIKNIKYGNTLIVARNNDSISLLNPKK
ncbi:MAG: VCBS repeat-containing protein [Ginsengibacter sp.]